MPTPGAPSATPWWRDAVFYEIYVRSYADGSGDGVGDLPGIERRLDHVVELGVDAIWLTPFYPSPMADHGYDVADPRGVEPVFGTLADFDDLIGAAHARGLRLLVDVVPNHCSNEHPWFREAIAAGPGSEARQRFLFRPGRGAAGKEPPNNWQSVFGGPAWTRVADGEWYLHLFTPQQPDLNWRHPDVAADYERTLRFWLDRGVDGFRIDVAHGLFKDIDLPDTIDGSSLDLLADVLAPTPIWNQPEVHDIYRSWHRICADYPHEPVLVGEVWIGDPHAVAAYVRADELHLAFNFRLLFSTWDCAAYRQAIEVSIDQLHHVGAPPTWVLSNHDVQRQVTRFGGGQVGEQRSGAAILLLLALPGPVFVYQGDELGLPEVALPDDAIQDPIWERSGHTIRGRDGCRVPIPWEGDAAPYGFCAPDTPPWLPMPADWADLTASRESAAPASMLMLYRAALDRRRAEPSLGDGPLEWRDSGPQVIDFVRRSESGESLRCLVNFGDQPVPLPPGQLLLASSTAVDGELPPDAAAWLRTAD
jgi:alpha-glucosidase